MDICFCRKLNKSGLVDVLNSTPPRKKHTTKWLVLENQITRLLNSSNRFQPQSLLKPSRNGPLVSAPQSNM